MTDGVRTRRVGKNVETSLETSLEMSVETSVETRRRAPWTYGR
jgi:hypothetical protein